MTPARHPVDLSVGQFRDAWRVMCRASPTHRFETTTNVTYVFSGVPVAFFNVAIVTTPSVTAALLRASGEEAMAWADGSGVPWLLVVTHEAIESGVDAQAVLAGCGLTPLLPLTGMRANRVVPADAPGGLALSVPLDEPGCGALVDVNSAAYGMDLAAAKSLLGAPAFWNGHVPALGCADDGAAVTSAAVLLVEGHRYVAMVATHPEHQRRGYAAAAMRHALDIAADRHGELPTVLHATDAGRPVYERMGYTPIATHTCYIASTFLAGH